VVEGVPIMSVNYCIPVPVIHFWPKLTHAAARSFCDSWASCNIRHWRFRTTSGHSHSSFVR